MDYLDMLQTIPKQKTALIEGSCSYTYGDLIQAAVCLRQELSQTQTLASVPSVTWISQPTFFGELTHFIALSGTRHIPVLLPPDLAHKEQLPTPAVIPDKAAMGVLTSGTTGTPSLWFRTFESWYDFFPTQNEIFSITSESRVFLHGSLAFTGNLNMALGILSIGAAILTTSPVNPRLWNRMIADHQADTIYLIPSKLRLLVRAARSSCAAVTSILSGSQSLGRCDIIRIKQVYPNSHCILYYGASELSYVTYIRDSDMGEDPSCVGKPFPGIKVTLNHDEILVDTPYAVMGVPRPFCVGDMGYTDNRGFLCLLGRKGRVYNIHGRKISAQHIENCLLEIPEIKEAAVTLDKTDGNAVLTAHVVLDPDAVLPNPTSHFQSALRSRLETWEIPRRFLYCGELPKNSSGKIKIQG